MKFHEIILEEWEQLTTLGKLVWFPFFLVLILVATPIILVAVLTILLIWSGIERCIKYIGKKVNMSKVLSYDLKKIIYKDKTK